MVYLEELGLLFLLEEEFSQISPLMEETQHDMNR